VERALTAPGAKPLSSSGVAGVPLEEVVEDAERLKRGEGFPLLYQLGCREMEMPLGIFSASVDEKGRLKLPQALREKIETQKAWFLSLHDDGMSLQLGSTGKNDQKVEIDPTGRVQIPADLSNRFKGEKSHVFWRNDRLVVVTSESFERMMLAARTVESPEDRTDQSEF
jgi:DNA-binding transcriptional regulator/RsmH inhibitor MraZ